jgi:HPt (histidine-containing phosphotransfer) domain-containing protein
MADGSFADGIAVLDLTVIEQMTRDIGNDSTNEFLEMFLAYAPEGLSGFQEAVATGNLVGIVHYSHDLKNSAATVGLMRLSRLCRDIELAADDKGLAEAIDLAEQLPSTMQQALQALTTLQSESTTGM